MEYFINNSFVHPSKHYKRKHKKTMLLNDKELAALNKYCNQYKVKNQSRLIRETLFTVILKNFEEDYPTLWNKKILAQLIEY